jgi:gliding motility-associated-like protein
MKLRFKYLITVLAFATVKSFSQNCPSLGPDQYLPCGVAQATLVANMTTCNPSSITAAQTTTYTVAQVPFAPQPTVGATNVTLSDDSQAGPFNIGFTFCFFGNSYNQFWIGSNGWVSFSAGQSNAFTSATIPSGAFNVPKNCIMGPWQDWHPGIAGGPYVRYQVLGTAPCRRLVVSWNNCPMFSCTTTYGTFQIVLYESTNVIENNLINKPNCVQWAGGTAVQGLHNLPGTIGITVPGRNSTQWTATNQTWRYSPAGAPVVPVLTWYQVGNPVPIGTGTSIVVTPPAAGEYYSCVPEYPTCYTGFGTCVNSVSNNFPDTVFVQPGTAGTSPTITAPTCIQGPTQISVAPNSATNTILWQGPGIQGPNNTPTITVNAGGTYTVTLSAINSTCTGSTTVQIGQTPTMNIASTSNSMCAFNSNNSLNSITLTATGSPNYTWTSFSGMTNTAPSNTTNSISFTPDLTSLTGSVTLLGASGVCTASATYSLPIIPNPTISATSASVCQGSTIQVSASGATTYSWFPSNTLSSSTGATVTANTNSTTVYSVIGNSVGCNSSTQTSTVLIVPNPTVSIAPLTNTICYGSSLNLSASGATNYTWSPAGSLNLANGPNVIASPSITTNYVVIGEQATCTTTAVYQVSVIILPSIIASVSQPTICQYSQTNINANGASSYSWSPPTGLSSTSGNQVVANPNVTTVYNIVGNNGQCFAFGSVTVVVVPFPNLNITTPNNRICQTNSTTIFATGADFYNWSPGSSLSQTNQPTAIAFPMVNTNYTVTGYNQQFGITCSMTKEIEIEVVPQVTANVSPSATLCLGEMTKLSAQGGPTYTWMPAEGLSQSNIFNPVASPTVSTVYTVNVSYYGDCGAEQTVYIHVNPNPTVNAGEDFSVNLDDPMYLNAAGSGTLTWIAGEGILCRPCPNTQIMPSKSSCYRIQAVNEFGCKAFDEVCVEVTTNYNLYIPNVFTPNNDGLNDVFLVYGTGISNFEMTIFDRWGEKLFVSKDQLTGWDGSYKGQVCKNDVYPYLVKFKALDGKVITRTGHVTLMK